MKTPKEVVEQFMPKEVEVLHVYREALENWVNSIQQDAFESGRVAGLNEAGNLCQAHEQTKTEYMVRLHNLIYENSQIVVTPTGYGYDFSAKITTEPTPPTKTTEK